MKKFQFSLQALQTLRERQEQLALQEYGLALKALKEAQNQVIGFQRALEAVWVEMRECAMGSRAALELGRLQAYCQTVEQRTRVSEHAAKTAQSKVSQAYTKLITARQARAVVDKFFEKQHHRYDLERRRREQLAQDEMVNHQTALTALAGMTCEPLWN
jgi:flagellar export protein FliJ